MDARPAIKHKHSCRDRIRKIKLRKDSGKEVEDLVTKAEEDKWAKTWVANVVRETIKSTRAKMALAQPELMRSLTSEGEKKTPEKMSIHRMMIDIAAIKTVIYTRLIEIMENVGVQSVEVPIALLGTIAREACLQRGFYQTKRIVSRKEEAVFQGKLRQVIMTTPRWQHNNPEEAGNETCEDNKGVGIKDTPRNYEKYKGVIWNDLPALNKMGRATVNRNQDPVIEVKTPEDTHTYEGSIQSMPKAAAHELMKERSCCI